MTGRPVLGLPVFVLCLALASAQPMSGVYPVGPRGPGVDSFPTIQAAAAALSSRGMAGNVEFPFQQFIYSGPVTVSNVAGSSSYKTWFRPTGIGATIDAGGSRTAFLVENSNNVTIQGLRFRGCRDTGSAFVRFLASDSGTVRSCRLEDSAQYGVQVNGSVGFRAESLKFEGPLLGRESRGLDFTDCMGALATRCTMLAEVGTGLWIEGGSENATYRVTTMGSLVHGLRIASSPMALIHNFVSRGNAQYGGYVTDSRLSMFDSCVFANASVAGAHFERCESLTFDMGMGIGFASRAVAVINSPYSDIMKLSVMNSPARGLYIKGSPECHVESTQYAGFFSDTAIVVEVDSSDCTMLSWTQMYGRAQRGLSVRKSTDVKVRHARLDMTLTEAGLYFEQADRAGVNTCSLRLAGPEAAVLVADSAVDDSFQFMTVIGTPRAGFVARGGRNLVLANSFFSGWTENAIRLEQARSPKLVYNTVIGPASGTSAGIVLDGASQTTALDNIVWNRGADSSACYRVNGSWPFAAGGSNYNDLYAPSGATGRVNDTLYRTLADWRTLPGNQDPRSIARDPLFESDSSHRLTTGSPCRDSGVPVPGFDYDMDGDERDPVSPDIGADEYMPPAVSEPPVRPAPASVKLLGNPIGSSALLELTLADKTPARLRLYDACGKRVRNMSLGLLDPGTLRIHLDLAGLPAGAYVIRLSAGRTSHTARLVKNR